MSGRRARARSAWKRAHDTRTAHHEAAHAVAFEHHGFGCHDVEIARRHGRLGATWPLASWHDEKSRAGYVVSLLAGYAAERRLARVHRDQHPRRESAIRAGAALDLEEAVRCFTAGESEAMWMKRAEAFVEEEWRAIAAVARELAERRRLDGEEVAQIVDEAHGVPGAAEALDWHRRRVERLKESA